MQQCIVSITGSGSLSHSDLITKHLFATLAVGSSKSEFVGVRGDNAILVVSPSDSQLVVTLANRQTETVMYVRHLPLTAIPSGGEFHAWVPVYPPGDPMNQTFDSTAPRNDQPRIEIKMSLGDGSSNGEYGRMSLPAPTTAAAFAGQPRATVGPGDRETIMGGFRPEARTTISGTVSSSAAAVSEVMETGWKAQQIAEKLKKMQMEKEMQTRTKVDTEKQLLDAAKSMDEMRTQMSKLEQVIESQKSELTQSQTEKQKVESLVEQTKASLEERTIAWQEMRKARDEMDRQLAEALSTREQFKLQLETVHENLAVNTDEVTLTKQQLDESKKQFQELNQTAQSKDVQLQDLQERLAKEQAVAEQARRELQQKAQALEMTLQEKAQADLTLTSVSQAHTMAESEREAARVRLQEEVKAANAAMAASEAAVAEKNALVSSLTDRYKQKAAEVDKLSTTLQDTVQQKGASDRQRQAHEDLVQRMEGKLDANREHITQLTDQLKQVQELSDTREAELQDLSLTLTSVREEFQTTGEQEKRSKARVAELQAELLQANARLRQTESEHAGLTKQAQGLDVTLAELTSDKDALKRQKELADSHLAELQQALDETRQQLHSKVQGEAQYLTSEQTMKESLAQLEAQLAAKADELGLTRRQIDDMQNSASETSTKFATLEERAEENARRLAASEQQKTEISSAMAALRSQHETLTLELIEKKQLLDQVSSHQTASEEEVSAIRAQVAVLAKEKQLREDDISSLRSELTEQAANVEEMTRTISEKQDYLTAEQTAFERAKQQSEEEYRRLQGEHKETVAAQKLLEGSLEESRRQWSSAQAQLSQQTQQHEADRYEVKRLQRIVEETEKDMSSKDSQLGQLQDILGKGEQILDNTRQAVMDKEDEIDGLRSQLQQMQGDMESTGQEMVNKLNQVKRSNKELERQLAEAEKKLTETEEKLAAVLGTVDDFHDENFALKQQAEHHDRQIEEMKAEVEKHKQAAEAAEQVLSEKARQLDRTVRGFEADARTISEKNMTIDQYIAKIDQLEQDLRTATENSEGLQAPLYAAQRELQAKEAEIEALQKSIAQMAEVTKQAEARARSLADAQAARQEAGMTVAAELSTLREKSAGLEVRLTAQVEHSQLQHDTITELGADKQRMEEEVELLVNGLHEMELENQQLKEEVQLLEAERGQAGGLEERLRQHDEVHKQEIQWLQKEIETLRTKETQHQAQVTEQPQEEEMRAVHSMPAAMCGVVMPQRPLAQNASRRKAVLVGCNYASSYAPLKGCINDAWNLRSLLNYTLQYSDEQIKLLLDQKEGSSITRAAPTKQGIMAALEWLVAGAQPGDNLLFAFSGYGAQHPRSKHTDQCESYLVPSDFDADLPPDYLRKQVGLEAAPELTAEEKARQARLFNPDTLQYRLVSLLEILDRLQRLPSSVKVTLLLDCCHSIVPNVHPLQGAPPMYTAIPRGRVDYLKLRDYIARPRFLQLPPLPSRHTPKVLNANPPLCRLYVLSACQLWEYCSELPIEGTVQGCFTWAFIKALAANQFRCNVQTAHVVVSNIMKDLKQHFRGIDQTPAVQVSQSASTSDIVLE